MGLEDKFSAQTWAEIQKLVLFANELNMSLICTNRGYSVKVYRRSAVDKGRRYFAFNKLVSLYNLGLGSQFVKELSCWEEILLIDEFHRVPSLSIGVCTLQRCNGRIISAHEHTEIGMEDFIVSQQKYRDELVLSYVEK